jgi:hypothetical protein
VVAELRNELEQFRFTGKDEILIFRYVEMINPTRSTLQLFFPNTWLTFAGHIQPGS